MGLSRKAREMECPQEWPEQVIPVQSLSDSGVVQIPERYIKPPSERPSAALESDKPEENIPLVDVGRFEGGEVEQAAIAQKISEACLEWGFFQLVNHGLSLELLRSVREVWREFFHLPLEAKKVYANSPKTYEGYGSRLGFQKGAILDWGDYFFLHFYPKSIRNVDRWPSLPPSCRRITAEYGEELVKLSGRLMNVLSKSLGLEDEYLQNAFGGNDIGACLRVNFYPKCPQPDLTLGLSAHSDPGGLTLLLSDDHVNGLQVYRKDSWVTVKPAPDSLIINIGDQVQVLSNAIYKSVEHRVLTNSNAERLSFAFFYNPRSDLLLKPAAALVTPQRPALYEPMTFNEYRLYIRTRGPQGKSHVDSLKSEETTLKP